MPRLTAAKRNTGILVCTGILLLFTQHKIARVRPGGVHIRLLWQFALLAVFNPAAFFVMTIFICRTKS
ncbi:hypothetical protein C7N43_37180 [Sphingobacteriales bacterium UPWRP_1]|nr:hypothetical protein BVG80_17730 [Sphingobacteriales bacterium TSM_CSM]PSJ71865.1 hypothetical protein C7N43_37180 [Sphingobacteriales bacterium UPWRP_1]